ncbi:MAG: hypothetical protein Q8R12_03525 [bacterium]|nr:hypothetical protein [bacterium]
MDLKEVFWNFLGASSHVPDAVGCVFGSALKTTYVNLDEKRLFEFYENGPTDYFLEAVMVFMWSDWCFLRLMQTAPDLRLGCGHLFSEHLRAKEFFLEQQGWFHFLRPDDM